MRPYMMACIIVSLVSATVYGWPALRRDLIAEKVRRGGRGLNEKQLGAVFSYAAWCAQGNRFFVGLIRDAIGTRRTVCGTLVLVMLGSTLIALAAGPDTSPLSQLNLSSCVPVTTQLISLIHSEMLKLS